LKILGISGSPRRGGNTDLLLNEVLRGATSKGAEVKTIILNDLNIAPCQHCDACLKTGKCKIDDDMQMVYGELEQADCMVLASPLHFKGLSAQTKAMVDRCQSLWVKRDILKQPPLGSQPGEKKGLFISVGGRQENGMFDGSLATVKLLFRLLDIAYEGELLFHGVDKKGTIAEYPDALKQAYMAGERLVEAAALPPPGSVR